MKMYAIDGAMLTETPEIRIGDKIYKVDNRLSTVKRIAEEIKASPNEEMDISLKNALGAEAHAEIVAMDLPVTAMAEIMITVSAAVNGWTVEETRKRFLGEK